MSDVVLRADSIRHCFGQRTVLNAATVWARAGQITALFGRNGSGKSTLFRIACGLLRADQGVVFFRGTAYQRPRLHRLAGHGLFYLPERGLLTRNRTVGQHLRLVGSRFGTQQRTREVIDLLGIGELLARMPDTLSGGERRRSEVAVAIARDPVCLVADEPYMGVAPIDAELLSRVFRQLANHGCAVLMSGHEVPQLMVLADDVVWMVAGTTHGLGAPAAAYEHWQFRREYLGA